MCTAATQTLLEDIIEEKTNAGEMFTAFDVSLVAKSRGETDRHRSIKHVVHDYFEAGRMPGDYTRTLMNVGAPEQAFVYHRVIDDVRTYQPHGRKGNKQPQQQQPIKAATPPTPVNSLSVVTPTQHDGGASVPGGATAKADARGTVLIPADVMRKAGFKPLANVAVYADPSEKTVVVVADKSTVPSGISPRSYTVDAANNVRVAGAVFDKAGLKVSGKGERFKVEYQQHKVTLKS
jgi:hypothetical protein